MKQRLVVAVVIGLIAAGVGIGVAIRQNQSENAPAIAIATGLLGFLFGLVFKFRMG